ncbi:hypothetical protein RND81_07G038400 [Saponaria officinalis]|uniref:Uncharacterized protein n=1 Tax=Saponaria officinalis TaxID=3572 RepID=A0AAW1JKA1_SAPOF
MTLMLKRGTVTLLWKLCVKYVVYFGLLISIVMFYEVYVSLYVSEALPILTYFHVFCRSYSQSNLLSFTFPIRLCGCHAQLQSLNVMSLLQRSVRCLTDYRAYSADLWAE